MKSTVEIKIIELVKSGHDLAKELHCAESAALISDLASQLEVQLVRSNALAAENAGLISSSECLLHEASEVYRAYNKTQLPDGDLVDEQCLQEVYDAINATPTTDAFLAEVRASAVDEACLKISNAIVNCYQDEQVGLDAAATICGYFAAQLRKGAAQ
ncbi:hypothetical protein [Citrobacter sp. CK206]|uniref:hypothetical protein n=1 Tax=Citrobacter sp. CK206 TaxID=2985115 RepID=UPI0025750A55|nr:hypothetical protein [Citrobacter sp. CK206]MDM2957371.1 hypothetical protein [Citrobacter sp. CK206]